MIFSLASGLVPDDARRRVLGTDQLLERVDGDWVVVDRSTSTGSLYSDIRRQDSSNTEPCILEPSTLESSIPDRSKPDAIGQTNLSPPSMLPQSSHLEAKDLPATVPVMPTIDELLRMRTHDQTTSDEWIFAMDLEGNSTAVTVSIASLHAQPDASAKLLLSVHT